LLGGNLNAVQPQAGSYNASYGTLLQKDSTDSYNHIPSKISGFSSPGEIRDMQVLGYGKKNLLLVARNDMRVQIFLISNQSKENINLILSKFRNRN
jgi:hypothetical protein